MQPNKPQPFRLPQRFDSPTLAKLAIPGEPTVIVRAVGVGSTAPFEYSDRNGRQAIFRYEREYDAHVLKVPASVWNHNNGFMAHELMDQRRLPHPLVVTVEIPDAQQLSKMAEALPKAASTIPTSQDGQEAKSSGPYPEAASASLAPATTSAPSVADALGIKPMKADESPEMDAPGNSKEASDVVVGQVSEQPGASATFSGPGLTGDEEVTEEAIKAFSSIQAPGKNEPAGDDALPFLAGSAWTLCEKPQRLKDLAGALNTDTETLKSAILHPLSAVELGHAGWVKRREPQA